MRKTKNTIWSKNIQFIQFITNNITVSEQQDQEKVWQGTLHCLAHSSNKGSNECHSQQTGCIYNTWEFMGEKEYQIKVWFYMCNIHEW